MSKTLNILARKDTPWVVDLMYGFDPKFTAKHKGVPGSEWDPDKKRWSYPVDRLWMLLKQAQESGYRVRRFDKPVEVYADPGNAFYCGDREPHEYQLNDALNMACSPVYLLTYEMGLGKTVAALIAAQIAWYHQVLVVGPAMAGPTWLKETPKWAEDMTAHWARPTSKKRWTTAPGEGGGGVTFVSYDLVERFLNEVAIPNNYKPDVIVADECHYLQNPETARSQAFARLTMDEFPEAVRWFLTGTLMTKDASSMHNPLDLLFPKRFGHLGKFRYRYVDHIEGEHGLKWVACDGKHKGIKHKVVCKRHNFPELKDRLAYFGSRVTKSDVSHLLPSFLGPFIIEGDPNNEVGSVMEWVDDALRQGITHLSIQTRTHKFAQGIFDRLQSQKIPAILSHGGLGDAEARDKLIEQAKGMERSVLVTTIDSTRESLDLTHVQAVLWAERTDNMAAMLQNMGRYQRMSGTHTVSGYMMQWGRRDDQADRMSRKMQAINMIQRAGVAEGALEKALTKIQSATELSPDEIRQLALGAALTATSDSEGMEEWNERDD